MEVYQYVSPERRDIVENLLIRFTQPLALNDPYECVPLIGKVDVSAVYDKIRREIELETSKLNLSPAHRKQKARELKRRVRERQRAMENDPSELRKHLSNFLRNDINRDLGILCLSKRPDSIVMWAHYGAGHTGLLLGFDAGHPFFSREIDDPPDLGTLTDVEYLKERLNIDWIPDEEGPEIYYRKDPDWSYEAEMRLVRGLCKAAKRIDCPPSQLSIFLFAIPPKALVSVTFGMHMSSESQAEVTASLARNKLLSHVKQYQAQLSDNSFLMDRTLLC